MLQQANVKLTRIKSLSSEAVSPIFVDVAMRGSEGVSGTFVTSELDGLSIIRSTTKGRRFQAARLRQHIRTASSHSFFACIPLGGTIALEQGGQDCNLSRGDIGLMDSSREYTLDISEALDALWIRVSPERLGSRASGIERFVAKRLDGSAGLGLIASRFIVATVSQIENLGDQQDVSMSSILLDLLCAAAATDAAWPIQSRTAARTFERARDFIDYHLDDEGLNPTRIAAGLGISTRYLAELFARQETTVMGWVTRRRLDLVRAAIEGKPWSAGLIAEIAYRYGFCNISSFNRAFRLSFGTSPRRLML